MSTDRLHIQANHPEAHGILGHVAAIIFEQTENTVPNAEFSHIDLEPALTLGLLTEVDGLVRFAESTLLRDYAVRQAVNIVDAVWENSGAFIDTLANVEHQGQRFGSPRDLGGDILLVLANENGRDIVSRFGEIAEGTSEEERSRSFWTLYTPFCEALPLLDVNPKSLARSLSAILRAVANDLAGGGIYTAVEHLAARSAGTADALYYAFLEEPDEPAAALVANALRGLATYDLPEAHRRAAELAASAQGIVRRAGIAALGSFAYSVEPGEGLLQKTLAQLSELRTYADQALGDALVRAYGDLLPRAEEAQQALVELSTQSGPNLQYQMALVLFRVSDVSCQEAWFKEAFLNLASAASQYTGTFNYLDY